MTVIDEAERLQTYHPFDQDVLDDVSEVAERQRSQTWEEVRTQLPNTEYFTPDGGKTIEVLDIKPKGGHDQTQVYHAPMGNGLDENITTRIAALAASQPNTRIITVGNPGAPGQNSNKLKVAQLLGVWMGDLRAAVDPTLQYLAKNGVETATHIGYSYGADKAATAAQHAGQYDQEVPRGILMEPASVKKRSMIGLASDFGSSAKALDTYVQATASDAYREARKLADKRNHGLTGYVLGLARLSNIAISHALATDQFEHRVDKALSEQDEMKVDVVWGSESELSIDSLVLDIVDRLQTQYSHRRVRGTVVHGQKHAMGDDIFLHAALILQSLKK
jgi:pimeloyl-ACP methyl ester carboxylesterase